MQEVASHMSITLETIAAKVRTEHRLHPQHKELLRLLASGMPNKVIQHHLGLTSTQLNETLRVLYRVSGTKNNRVRLAVWTAKRGLV